MIVFNFDKQRAFTPVGDKPSKFRPEQSLSVKEILERFAFIDGEPLRRVVAQGYPEQLDDESMFDQALDWDSLDMAERQDLYEQSKEIVERFEAEQTANAVKHSRSESDPHEGSQSPNSEQSEQTANWFAVSIENV